MPISCEYYAHTPNQNGEWHLLKNHLLGVADLATSFASSFGAGTLGRILGILHDLGKASDEFQKYLQKCNIARSAQREEPLRGPDHKLAGAKLASRICQPLVFPILGHHGRLPDLATAKSMLNSDLTNNQLHDHILSILEIEEEIKNFDQEQLPEWITNEKETELFIRMLFSVLVDADFLDSEAHWRPDNTGLRGQSPQIESLWERLQKKSAALDGLRPRLHCE